MIAAFSRSSRPMRPMSLDSVTCAPGSARFKDLARLGFALRVDRAEHRGDRDRADTLGPDVGGDAEEFGFVERRNLAAVELMAAVSEIGVIADRAPEIFGPVDHRRQRGGRRQAKTHGGGRREVAPLHHRVGEMGRADHDDVDRLRLQTGCREHGLERRDDARHHVRRRHGLDAGEDLRAVHDDRVGVGAADVDADPDHARLPCFARVCRSSALPRLARASGAREMTASEMLQRQARTRPGIAVSHGANACGQRVWNAQPAGWFAGLGISPSTIGLVGLQRRFLVGDHGNGRDQRAGVGMSRRLEQLSDRPDLDQAPEIEDADPVAKLRIRLRSWEMKR